jgi:uncharacterized protein YegL
MKIINKARKAVRVVFILDKSGSMGSCETATIEGFNEYLSTLKKDKKADYTFSLTLFDTVLTKLYEDEPIRNVKELTKEDYQPSGMTALYDAVGHSIKEKSEGKTLVVIMTDGAENSSREYDAKSIQKLIKGLEAKDNHTFVFLGANQDSWATGSILGIPTMNTSNFNATGTGVRAAMVMMAQNTSSFASSSEVKTSNFLSKKDQSDLSNA